MLIKTPDCPKLTIPFSLMAFFMGNSVLKNSNNQPVLQNINFLKSVQAKAETRLCIEHSREFRSLTNKGRVSKFSGTLKHCKSLSSTLNWKLKRRSPGKSRVFCSFLPGVYWEVISTPGLSRTERHKTVGETGKKQSSPLMAAPLPKFPKHLERVQQLWCTASHRSCGGHPTSWVTEPWAAAAPRSRCGTSGCRSPK